MVLKKTLRLLSVISISMFCVPLWLHAQTWNSDHLIGTVTGIDHFAFNQVPDQLVEIHAAATPNTGLSYQWESSTAPTASFTNISGATSSSYSFSAALTQATYFRRKTTYPANGNYIYSNTIKISVVSVNWEDMNYIREHDVLTTNITDWQAVDQLAIGSKLQTTTYLDGLGRLVENVSRETATPSNPNNLWGDMVQFSQYDVYGRQPVNYLPYTTTSQSGKFKTATSTGQPQYYTTTYNETSAFSTITFDNSPLNRVMNVKQPGTSWAASNGNAANYDVNTAADAVKVFSIDYVQGDAPALNTGNYPYDGNYPANSLYKLTYTDENGKQVVEFINTAGQLILKKVQLDNTPAGPYTGWICTYNIYDDFGLLRYQLSPEAVKYLSNNSWSFAGTNGQQVLNELCFQYNYDEKGRSIWKKAPGAQPLRMLYDIRDRVVFMQDGNQAALTTPQWTANLYDDLDRSVISTLYNTSATTATLQTDINNAAATSTVTINNTGTVSVTAVVSYNPITSTNLNSSSVTTILKYQFYDNYAFNAVKTFDNNFTNTAAYNTSDPNVQSIAKTNRVTDMPTGSMTRVLGATTFLSSTQYYDEKGRPIQNLEDNIKAGVDITTLQYHFDGRMLSTCNDHTTPSTGYTNYKTLTKYLFDKLGRVTSIQKQFGSNAFKTVSAYDYDDAGRVKTKHLDPGYNNPNSGQPDIESLNYSFNIHNQITGINKDYALKNTGYDKWSHFFGLYLGFDNRDNVFSAAQLNGQVTGQLWNTQGDDAQRKYDYTYDNAGRLVNAAFKEQQHPGDGWANNKMDFSITGSSGQITYDLNGNLLTMLQKGIIPGTATPVTIDDLHYSYASYSNKLQSVTDQMTNTNSNGKFGDFKDGSNGANPDYVYDANGNVVIDLNKNAKDLDNVVGANGIKYNFLDKPEQIRIAGKGTIQITYSADGEKLKRVYTPETGTGTTTTYINQFVYQASGAGADVLSFINFEEGRIRVITPTSQTNGYDVLTIDGNMDLPNSKKGVYDYYIMDYLQNVRMILTEETHSASNICTMETGRATAEEPIFGQTGSSNEVATTRYATSSTSWQNGSIGSSVSRLGNLAGHIIGPNTLQKVMAGDKVSATAQYYFQTATGGSNSNFASALLSSLAQAITGGSVNSVVQENVTNVTSQLNLNPEFINSIQPGSTGNTPRAYLTILFFDERFNFIQAADGGAAQQQVASSVGSSGSTLGLANIKAPKNGYVYVYISNQSDQDVYFDNFQAGIVTGNIIEENHYYAYGLKIATISSKKLGDSNEGVLKNNNFYNGKELFDDADLNWYDYGFRNYDPQIGRFMQLDPLTDEYSFLTPYQYASCDPITNIDIDGLEGGSAVSVLSTTAETAKTLGEVVIYSHKALSTGSKIGTASNTASKIAKIATATRIITSVAGAGNKVLNSSHNTVPAGSIKIDPKSVLVNINTRTSCHIMNDEVQLAEQVWWYNVTKDLDKAHGQVLPTRSPVLDIIFGKREIDDPSPKIIVINKLKLTLSGKVYVGADGYIKGPVKKVYTGTPPIFGIAGSSANIGFLIEEGSQLEQIWGDSRLFKGWLKGGQSLSRVASPLNPTEAQQLINNAKALGMTIESNLKGLKGLEQTGQWKGIPHFKIGNTHIPIQSGIEALLKF
jgi:RHS repeat-associated protein